MATQARIGVVHAVQSANAASLFRSTHKRKFSAQHCPKIHLQLKNIPGVGEHLRFCGNGSQQKRICMK